MKKPSYTFGDTMKIGGHYLVIDEISMRKGPHDEEPRMFYGSKGHYVEDKYLENAPEKETADAVESEKEELNPDPDGTVPEVQAGGVTENQVADELDEDPDGTVGEEGDEEEAEENEKAPATKKSASKKKG